MRLRQIAPVALVLGLTVAGFITARMVVEHAARRDAEHRVEVAAAQLHDRVAQAVSLTESLRRFMAQAGGTGVTNAEFTRNAFWWLSPPDFPAAGWVEQVPASRRAAYEQRLGQPIVSPDAQYSDLPRRSRSYYLPATLVSGFPPMSVPGIDLSGEPGMAAALKRATRLDGVAAAPLGSVAGTRGLFLVAPAPNLINEVLRPGYVVLFVPDATLVAAADVPGMQLAVGSATTKAGDAGTSVGKTFQQGGQRFDVVVPQQSPHGAAEALPWIILAAGLVLAGFAGALGLNAGRRDRAQAELDRIFNLSSDLIGVADLEGCLKRVNPAFERTLGYSSEELRSRPYVEFIHPDDRSATLRAADALAHGREVIEFENRYLRKDGSVCWLEWNARSAPGEAVIYAAGRDVTERRQLEEERERLAQEQAALRRVATVVAQGGSQSEVFNAIAEELRQLIDDDFIEMLRYEDDRTVVSVAAAGAAREAFAVGARLELGGDNATSVIRRTGETVRIDDYNRSATGAIAEAARPTGIRSAVGTPLIVDDRLWGAVTIATTGNEPLPPNTESRLGQFTELMATAIANTESREALRQLADEQAALRRVATLVAEGASPGSVFDAVAAEMEAMLDADQVALNRFEPGGQMLALAHRGADVPRVPPGSRVSTVGESATARVRRTGRPARMENYERAGGALAEGARATGLRSSVAVPIALEGSELWGVITASWKRKQSPPADTEERMFRFAQLMATAIANAEARAEVERLADEQAALRRVATAVARGGSPDDVFGATVAELHAVVAADTTALIRYEADGSGTLLAALGESGFEVGSGIPLIGESVSAKVQHTGRTARVDNFETASGPVAQRLRARGVRSGVGAPIVVEGRLWGVMTSGWTVGPPPPDSEARVAQFTDLVGTAIANAESRAELLASRARIVTTADQTRRRMERDLHDGAQQRLVTLTMKLRALQAERAPQGEAVKREVAAIAAGLDDVLDDLRETARGLHPVILSRGGLEPALKALGRRSSVPVEFDLRAQERLPEPVEVAAYYVVAEALTNAAKHAHASFVRVQTEVVDGDLSVSVQDDGVGGANPARGSGLVGLTDRVEALGGKLNLRSPQAAGTRLHIDLPLSGRAIAAADRARWSG